MWMRQFGRYAWIRRGALALFGLCPLAGCTELPTSAWKQLNAAEVDYRSKNYRDASRKLDKLLDKYPRHADCAQAYYLRSLCSIAASNKVGAESDARRCLKFSKDPLLMGKAHATLATLLFEANRTREALPHFAKALQRMAEESPKDVFRYRHGLCLQREGRWKEARLEFAAVFQRFPSSSAAQHAKRFYDWSHQFYSIQCGAFREKKAAADLNVKLRRTGLKARVENRPRRGESLHTVFVGKYARFGQARDALPAVQRRVSDAFVVPQ